MIEKVSFDTICLPSENVVARVIEDDIIIVPLVAGIGNADDEIYTLNETGRAIWQQLDGQKSLNEVIINLSKEFSCPIDEIKNDVLGFVSEMINQGMIEKVK